MLIVAEGAGLTWLQEKAAAVSSDNWRAGEAVRGSEGVREEAKAAKGHKVSFPPQLA